MREEDEVDDCYERRASHREVDGCGKTRVICESGCEATYIKRPAYRDTGRFIPWSPTPI